MVIITIYHYQDIKLVQKLKGIMKNLKPLALLIDNYYKIIEIDASSLKWLGILIQNPNKDSPKEKEEIAIYIGEKFTKIKCRKSM